MPRSPRVRFENAIYHVTGHGVDETVLFHDDGDRGRYLELLAQAVDRTGFRILAYALMTTHLHLVVQTPRANVSAAMQWLHGRYAARFNHCAARRGHLFRGRFYSGIIDTDAYLLEVTRYTHLNPVRAGLVARPEDYPWSSYRRYLGEDNAGPADPSLILDMVTLPGVAPVMEYRRFVEEPLGMHLRTLPPGAPGWNDLALAAVADALGILRQEIVGRRLAWARKATIILLADELGLSAMQIADLLEMKPSSVKAALRKISGAVPILPVASRVAAARDILRSTVLTPS